MSYKPPMGDPEMLKRRIISNPKYEAVQPTIECGVNVNLAKLIRESEPSVKQGKDELFRRVRASTVANALEEIHLELRMREYAAQDDAMVRAQRDYTDGLVRDAQPPSSSVSPARYNMQENGSNSYDEFRIPKPVKREYLILDVRDREDYEKCHILNAIHFPPTKLNHATNPFTPEILQFKNKENKVIVLYDLDEEIVVGRRIGNLFFERGCDNVVIISGGLKEFVQVFSHLILGESPVPIVPRNQRVLSRGGTSVSGQSQEGSKLHSVATSHKPKSLSTSLARSQSSSWK